MSRVPSLGATRRRSLGEIVAEQMREAIFDGRLAPGQHLVEEDLSDELQVSRGPIRDAYAILEREGLITISRNRGSKVAKLSARDLGEVYSLRSTLDVLAVRFAARRRDTADVANLEEALENIQRGVSEQIDAQKAARLDVEFHDAIYAAAHHDRLTTAWSAIRMQTYWFLLRRNVSSPDWVEQTVGSHRLILDLIVAADETGAERAMREHIRESFEKLASALGADADDPIDPAGYLLD